MRGARVRLELLQFACLIVSQLGSISTLCLIPTVHSFSSLRVQRNTHGVLANPDLSQAMAPSKKKRTHAVFCISSAHRLASTSKPRFVEECGRVKHNEICSKGRSSLRQKDVFNDGPYIVYGASGVIGTTSDYQNEIPYVAIVKDGAGVGRANACEPMTSVLGTMQALIPNPNVERDYLLHLVRSLRLGEGFSGSTIPHIYFKDYGRIEVPLPPLGAQKRIVSQLGLVEAQITQAEAQIEQLDRLVKSRFIEMFGDLSGYESRTLKECVSGIESGKSPKCLAKPREGNNPGVLKLSAISSGIYKETENKALPSDAKATDGRVVCDGDILLARKNTPELVGQSVFVNHTDGNIMFPDIVFRMHAKYEVDGVYLSYALAHPLAGAIKSLAHGSAKSMSNIPKSELVRLPIPLPPLALQREFATFVSQVDKSRFATHCDHPRASY